ncbi:MAG: hypothetical protein KKI08_19010 [Armatimonadetes bacterium]|nr:hypothetical protein [Armatimonadota bacterium]
MKTRLTITILAALALTTLAFAQPPGGKGQGGQDRSQRRGAMGAAMFIEQSWSALCFEINLSATQIAKLKPSYVWAYKARNAALKTAREQHSFDSVANTLNYIKKTLEDRIPIVLTAAQKTAWQKWQAEQEAMRNRTRQGGAGKAGGGGGGGQK